MRAVFSPKTIDMGATCDNLTQTEPYGSRHVIFASTFYVMSFVQIIGLIAAFCTTISFLPQVIKTWKSGSAKDLSLGMFSFFCLGVLLWLIYGIMERDVP